VVLWRSVSHREGREKSVVQSRKCSNGIHNEYIRWLSREMDGMKKAMVMLPGPSKRQVRGHEGNACVRVTAPNGSRMSMAFAHNRRLRQPALNIPGGGVAVTS